MVFGPRLFLSYYVTPLHVTLTLLAAYKAQDVGWRKVLVAVTLHLPQMGCKMPYAYLCH